MRYLKTGQSKSFGDDNQTSVVEAVKSSLSQVRNHGDKAIRELSEKFDKWSPESFLLSEEQIQECIDSLDEQTLQDLHEVQGNVRRFAEAQLESLQAIEVEV